LPEVELEKRRLNLEKRKLAKQEAGRVKQAKLKRLQLSEQAEQRKLKN